MLPAHIALLGGLNPAWVAVGILLVTYAVIMSEKINRAVVALIGAIVMIGSGILSQEEAIAGIDFNTVGLLAGMMIIVAVARRSGVFEYLAIWTAQVARGHPAGILVLLSLITAVLSSLLDNVTTVLLIVPVSLVICSQLKVPPYPFLLSQVLASNIGGTATMIGDPPNIIISAQVGLSFNAFVTNLAPVIVVILACHTLAMHLFWGRHLRSTAEARAHIMAMDARRAITDRALLIKSLSVLALVLVSFSFAHQIGMESGAIGLGGAALLLLLDNLGRSAEKQTEHVTEVFNEVEWITLFFFMGLFVVVKGVEHTGVLDMLAQKLVAATGGQLEPTGLGILWSSALLSSALDNIPFVATMIPMIKAMGPAFGGAEGLDPLWWALSLGACLGGNGTLVGASANLTVAGIAERNGVSFRFLTYTKHALPMMLVQIAICHGYWLWRYC
ncbi:sodium:proton antiporter [Actomonas aquatica]|uniref:ArsB/NhaD family transporter n=1 Tax=Actomonas aquatica TaxID=2866162 RepID=A0ABZ1C741_9BACT|nr:ArsB/NhaD family transporter [Opitutus sp. WL0086]WRQ87460.1 ArsB/NhaD family transporter [Opitutus sp. WL0086]